MSDLKLTVDQLKNYLGTGLKCKVKHKTIGSMEVKNPMFTLDSINASFTRAQFWTFDSIFCDQFGFTGKGFQKNEFNPICYRLSDLDKFIPELGFVPLDEINNYAPLGKYFGFAIEKDSLGQIGYRTPESWLNPLIHIEFLNKLFQWHFWPFGDEYFEEGLIIDKLKT